MKIHEVCQSRYHTSGLRFGLELEMEGLAGRVEMVEPWGITEDGSLRDGGYEYISQPWTRDELTGHLDSLYEAIDRMDPSTSIRTSTHVHVNMQEKDQEQLELILGFSILAEPLLMSYCGPEREECIYCVPFYRADNEVDAIRDALNSPGYNLFMNTCKYSGLFTAPLLTFGTIEYRHAPFWRDRNMLEGWLDIITTCVTADERFDSLEDMIAQCDRDPWAFFSSQFGPQLFMMCSNASALEELMDQADVITIAERLQPCTYKAVDVSRIDFGGGDNNLSGYYRTARRRPAPSLRFEHEPEDEYYDEEEW